MAGEFKHPTIEGVIAIHNEVMAAHGGSLGIRSRELLESALAAPQATMMGKLLLEDPIEISAAYLFYLSSNHPFMDGNKRVALATCLVCLSENGLLPSEELDCDAWEEFILSIASGELTRVAVTESLRRLLKNG